MSDQVISFSLYLMHLVELRGDRNSNNVAFELPVDEILPQGVEFTAMVFAGMKELSECHVKPKTA